MGTAGYCIPEGLFPSWPSVGQDHHQCYWGALCLHHIQLCQQKLDTRSIWRKVRNAMPLISKVLERHQQLGRNGSTKNQWITGYIIHAKKEVTDLDKWWVSIYNGVWINPFDCIFTHFFFFLLETVLNYTKKKLTVCVQNWDGENRNSWN